MNVQMMVETKHESISPENKASITIDARVVNEPTTATISNLSAGEPITLQIG